MKITQLVTVAAFLAFAWLWDGLLPRAWAVNILNPSLNYPLEPSPDRNNFNSAVPATDSPGNLGKYAGNWNSWTGTPIAPNYIITAKHIHGSTVYGPSGSTYSIDINGDHVAEIFHAVHGWTSPTSDLVIYRIDGTIPSGLIAPLYTPVNPNSNPEIGKPFVVWGRGGPLDQEVRVSGDLKGWKRNGGTGPISWGENVVAGVVNDPFNSGTNELLTFDFTRDTAHGAVTNEAAVALGDSGGGVFILDGGVWKLAAVNSYVDGAFNTTNSGVGFDASLFDTGGLYYGSQGGGWTFEPDTVADKPVFSYSTRISKEVAWINSVLNDVYGDFDDDGDVDAQDIDILWSVIRPEVAGSDDPGGNDSEDLNGDGYVNEDDVDFMLAQLLTAGPNRQYGDADLDGGVGGLDYTLWRNRAGTGWEHGDFDGDGGVGGLDYTLWRTRPTVYPGSVGPHAGSGSLPGGGFIGVVPEPSAIILALLGLPTLLALRRRRASLRPRELR